MYKKLQTLQNRYVAETLNKLRPTFDSISSAVKESADSKGRVSIIGFNEIQSKVAYNTDYILATVFSTITFAVKDSISLNISDEEIVETILSSGNMDSDIIEHKATFQVQLDMMLSSFTYPGRKIKDSLTSLNNMFSGKYTPITIEVLCSALIGYYTSHAYNASLVYKWAGEGVGRVKLSCEDLPELDDIYDIRFVPEPDALAVYTKLEPYKDMEEDTIFLDGINTYVWSPGEIAKKEEKLDKIKNTLPEFYDTIKEEVDFLKSVTNYFNNKSTSAFTREVELVCSKIYNAELLPANSPFDLINSKFLIEVKASNASDIADDERGHIAKGELVRKYVYATDMFLQGKSQANHKYVLGVYDKATDRLTIYEQNYLSNKNSGMMFPVAIVHEYSSIGWTYKSTDNTNIMVDTAEIIDTGIEMLVSDSLLNSTAYLEVIKATKYGIKSGDTVISFDREDISVGVVGERVSTQNMFGTKYFSLPISDLLSSLIKDSFSLSREKLTDYPQDDLGICISFRDLHLCPDLDKVSSIFLDKLLLTKAEYAKVEKFTTLRDTGVTIADKTAYKAVIENQDYSNKIKVLWNGYEETLTYTDFNDNCRLVKQGYHKDLAERISSATINESLKQYALKEKQSIAFSLKDVLTKSKF